MKIAYCIPSLHINGGMERVLSIKANYFADVLGYDVSVIMTDAKDKGPFFPLSNKIRLIQLDVDFEELWNKPLFKKIYLYSKKMREYKRKLRECLMNLRPDITISMLRREINFLTKIEDGSLKIGEMHMNRNQYRNLNQDSGAVWIKRLIVKYWNHQLLTQLKRLDKFVVLTDHDKAEWVELDNVITIGNPVAFYLDNPSDCTQHSVVSVGRYCYQKGFDLLLDSWKIVSEKHPDWSLNIYGDDGEKIKKHIERNHITSSVNIHGITSNIQERLRENSIFVLSSRFEGFGMVITEAMACGLPPVAFNCKYGPAEIIKDGEDGILVEPENVQALADTVCELIEDEERRKRLGQAAHENVKRYTIERVGQKWNDLFCTLCSTK